MKLFIKLNLLFALLYGGLTHAFTYQGELTDQGVAFTGAVEMSFSLFDNSTMGNAVGSPDMQLVTVTNGRFVVNLDQWMLFFDGTDLWLQIEVDLTGANIVTLTPRQKLNATPYAEFSYDGIGDITAVSAGTGLLGGGATGDVNLSVNTSIIQQRVGSSCAVGQAIRSIAADGSVTCQTTSGGSSYSAGTGLTLTGTTFNVNVGSGNGLDSDLLDGLDSTAFMVATADSWVNTAGDSMTGKLDITNSDSSFMLSVQNSDLTSGDGIRAFNNSPNSFGGALYASNTSSGNGVYGVSTSGFGVHGVTNGTTGTPYGVFGRATGNNGETSYGVRGESSSASGTGVGGVAPWVGILGEATATTGENWGVYGKTASTVGYGVYGTASNTGGKNFGVYGVSSSVNGYGVYGKNTNAVGAGVRGETQDGNAVEGVVDFVNGVNGTGTGVYGSGGFFGAAAKFENAVTGTAAVTIQNIASPTAPALEVTGATHLEGPVTWKPVTSYVSIPAAAFTPREDGYDFMNNGRHITPGNSTSKYYLAAMQLPHGSIVTNFTFYWRDSSNDDGQADLYRIGLDGTEGVMAAAPTINGGSGQTVTSFSNDNTISDATIDNSLYSYYVWLTLPVDGNGDAVRAHGIVIEYTINKPY